MPENDLLKRLLDAGMTLTTVTQSKAEDLIRELARATESRAETAQETIDELVERSRRSSERLMDTLRTEVREQVEGLRHQIENLVSKDDLSRVVQQLASMVGRDAPAPSGSATGAEATSSSTAGEPVEDAGVTPTPALSAGGAKTAPTKAAKKTPAKKSPAKKATGPAANIGS